MHAAADSGCNESVHQMCELPNYGRVPVATEVMALCRPSDDGRLLGLMHRWRRSGEPYIPVCPSVGRNLSEFSAGDLSQPDFSGVWMPTSAVWALYGPMKSIRKHWPTSRYLYPKVFKSVAGSVPAAQFSWLEPLPPAGGSRVQARSLPPSSARVVTISGRRMELV